MPIKYDGEKVKRPGTVIQWTEQTANELAKCYIDPIYFALNHCKVLHTTKGITPLELRPYQVKALRMCKDKSRVIMLLPRQSGKTTITAIYVLHKALFSTERQNIYILSNKGESSKDFLERIKTIYSELPSFLKRGVTEWNKTSVQFEGSKFNETGSAIYSSTTSPDAIRGRSASLLVLDEFAHVPVHVAQEFWTSAQPSVAEGGQIIIISTPKGNTGEYYKIYTESVRGQNEFANLKVAWDEIPGRDEKFREKTIKEIGLVRWNQEYATEFIGSSSTLINGESLEALRKTVLPPEHEFGNLDVWKKPIAGHIYVLGVDVSMGVGSDYSVIQIIDITNPNLFEQVAVFSDNYIRTVDLTAKVHELAKSYNEAFVIIENNTYGHDICRMLWEDYQYEWLYQDDDRRDRGVFANKKTKTNSNAALKRVAEEKKILIRDERTLKEMFGYVELSIDKYGCEEGENSHDDRVDALRWVCYFTVSPYWRNLEDFIREERSLVKNKGEEKDLGQDDSFKPIYFKDAFGGKKELDEDGFNWNLDR